MRVILIMTVNLLFSIFTVAYRMSPGSKYDEIEDFYTLLNGFINTHKATNTKTKNRKNRILNNINQLYNHYFNLYKKIQQYEIKNEEKRGRDYKQFEKNYSRSQEPKSTRKVDTETKNLIKSKNHHGLVKEK